LQVIKRVGASKVWPLVGHVWRDSESIAQSADEWEEVWSHAYDRDGNFRKGHRRVMSAPDRRVYDALPKFVTIYRGCESEDYVCGYSWTLDRERAEWFARRFSSGGVVAKAEVHKSVILAYFSERNESEIVVDVDFLNWDWEITALPELKEAA
jgi:hypothetical protein